ncbi:hypothetical protein [Laspinema palackyanum]|uniref:hypothetical protein n=1 Tax=Laspinema palackyanum TaxID=3231601 RepID=UPI00345D139D|nr:hypothetical protein [Laspinema sp. D2c]
MQIGVPWTHEVQIVKGVHKALTCIASLYRDRHKLYATPLPKNVPHKSGKRYS